MDFTLHSATAEDQQFLADLFADVHAPEFAPLGLPAASLDQLLAMQFNAQRGGYAAQFPRAYDRIVRVGEMRVGRLLIDEQDGKLHLIDIALIGSHRGHGIGERLLRGLCDQAQAKGMPLKLSVRFGNRAQRLYERMGFVRTGGNGVDIDMEFQGRGSTSLEASAESDSVADPSERVPQDYTGRYFRTLIGRTISARNQNGVSVQIVLKAVQATEAQPEAGVDPGDSFVLTFRGPTEPILGSEIAELSLEGADDMTMLLTPFAADADGVSYEAVFNRMRLR